MSKVIGYICGTDDTDLSLGATDVVIYPTIDDLKKHRSCYEECGVQEVLLGEFVILPMPLQDIVRFAKEREKNDK